MRRSVSDTRVAVKDGEGWDTTLFLDPATVPTRCWADNPTHVTRVCWRLTTTEIGLCRAHRCEILGQDCFTPEERTAYNRRHDA